MPDLHPPTGTDSTPQKLGPDPLAGLYHMSNTAGVSTQDYVAINPTAIAALLLGFASILIVLSNSLLVIPAVGVICSIIAIVQIRRSNQTQTGKGLALVGLALCLLLGAGKAGRDGLAAIRARGDEQQIAAVTRELGKDLAAKNYEHAYQRFTDAFRQRVPLITFQQAMETLAALPNGAPLVSLEWNQQRMVIEERGEFGVLNAYSMTLFQYEGSAQPRRIIISFEKAGGAWQPNDLPAVFETKKKQQ